MKTVTTLTGNHDVTLKAIETRDLAEMSVLANDPAIAANLRNSFPSLIRSKTRKLFLPLSTVKITR